MDAEPLDALDALLPDGLQRRRTGGHGRVLAVRDPASGLYTAVTASGGDYMTWIDGAPEPFAPLDDPQLAARRVAAILAPASTAT